MNKVHVLDCTLRDGGYCNEWRFGSDNIKSIVKGLVESNIEIIECGFITNKEKHDIDETKFNSIEEVEKVIPKDKSDRLYVVMLNYGEYDVEELPESSKCSVDGIRVAFHKKELQESLKICNVIKSKGYQVFVQAMVSLNYTDDEFLSLINAVNSLEPYAFYIVDSFGVMKEKDLVRLFYVVEHNLNENVWIGFHSHNNMQLAYSNAQHLINVRTNRNLIIDTSIMGMGRGAGNLNTELFLGYLNENANKNYNTIPILNIADKILNHFYERKFWGYSLPNYISAVHNAHPNYADFLDSKKTLTFEDINNIFNMMDEDKKVSFDKAYIEQLYLAYQEKGETRDLNNYRFMQVIKDKSVLIIAPGRSSIIERERIIKIASRKDVITISINYDYDEEFTDFIFLSNLRRYHELSPDKRRKCITTSNIPAEDVYLTVKYKELLNPYEMVEDNAGLMLIQLLMNYGIQKVYLAGMDGYSNDPEDNYADQRMSIYTEHDESNKRNKGINAALMNYSKNVEIVMLTTPRYIVGQRT